jgi:hypothetical protein
MGWSHAGSDCEITLYSITDQHTLIAREVVKTTYQGELKINELRTNPTKNRRE